MGQATEQAQQYTGRELRWLADNREQAQRMRVETGERIRAVVQGRDETFVPDGAFRPEDPDHLAEGEERRWVDPDTGQEYPADRLLEAVTAGETRGPVRMLGRTYRRYAEEERAAVEDFRHALEQHPAWPWLQHVKGVGPTLAGKLLSRLDAREADTASAFWKYCGLATVPGEQYRCDECGLTRGWPVGYDVTGKHQRLDRKARCEGLLEKVAGPDDGVRVAQPRPRKGEPASYDAYAKKICWQVVTSFLKTGARADVPYERKYRRWRAQADDERPGWADGRKDHLARRKTAKLFLSHLWVVWRAALGLERPDPYAVAELGHSRSSLIGPWDMVDAEPPTPELDVY